MEKGWKTNNIAYFNYNEIVDQANVLKKHTL